MAFYNIPIVFKIFALLTCISRMFNNNNVIMVNPIKVWIHSAFSIDNCSVFHFRIKTLLRVSGG